MVATEELNELYIVYAEDHDWMVVFHNGKFIVEDHRVDLVEAIKHALRMGPLTGITSGEITNELSEEGTPQELTEWLPFIEVYD